MKNVLIVIDAQNDFITGSLALEGANEKTDLIAVEITKFLKNDDLVYFTQDTHYKDTYLTDTLEGKKLPVEHCIADSADSNGWDLDARVHNAWKNAKAKSCNSFIYCKFTFGSIGFVNTIEDELRDKHNIVDYTDVVFYITGFATDICLISNALILRAKFPNSQINIIEKCCAGTSKEAHDAALLVAKSCQIDII